MIQMTKATPQEAATVATLALRMWNDNTLEGFLVIQFLKINSLYFLSYVS